MNPDVLAGYKLTMIMIEDEAISSMSGMTHHRNLVFTGIFSDIISRTVFGIKATELQQTDENKLMNTKKPLITSASEYDSPIGTGWM